MISLDLAKLEAAVAADAAIRRRQRLQPVAGPGDKIFPPTYPSDVRNAPPSHVFERRKIAGGEVWCVLVDSVQSQANRLEESLRNTIRNGNTQIPHVLVDFRGHDLEGIVEITSLEAPHRVYDAILRDSLLDGQPFMKSATGQQLAKAKPEDASALLEFSPTALLFGAWHSTGEGGGLGAKFARCLTSEIVAIDVPIDEIPIRSGELVPRTSGRRTGSRIDPLGVLRGVPVYKGADGWDVTKDGAGKGAKEARPSEINHGNIRPSVTPLGITCDYIEHTFVLSFASLRRLGFGSPERSHAGRMYLAALGLLALCEQDHAGYSLRSRCDLVCDGRAPLEIVHPDGSSESVEIDLASTRTLYSTALERAQSTGLSFQLEPLRLTPQDKLVAIVRASQELALAGEGGDNEDGQ